LVLRSSEFIKKEEKPGLLRRNIRWCENGLNIHLENSKTDPFNQGTDIKIYATNNNLCPIKWIRRIWENAENKKEDAPVFQVQGKPLTYSGFQKALKLLIKNIKLDEKKYSSHSLRIGGATTLALLGYPAHVIQKMGRWKSLTYQLYTRLSDEFLKGVSQRMSKAAPWEQGMAVHQAPDLQARFSNKDA